jgi:hypothetical protein
MRAFIVTAFVIITTPALAQSETVVEISSRGQQVRALFSMPANPVGSVILLAGGHGKLDISADGKIAWGRGNQLVRTRALYAKAGFATLVPDIAPDHKTRGGVVAGYRVSPAHAQDLGAMVQHLRAIKAPVVMIGTSRGSISTGNALVRLKGAPRPDAAVVTSAFLAADPKDFSVRKSAGDDPKRLDLPMLVVEHKQDGCPATAPSTVAPFKAWYEQGGRKLDVIWMEGGDPPTGDPCEAFSPHGFVGLDQQVVTAVTGWIKTRNLAAR